MNKSILACKVVTKLSTIPGAGRGLFADEDIAVGRLILNHWTQVMEIVSEKEFQVRAGGNDSDPRTILAKTTGIRIFGPWFAIAKEYIYDDDHPGSFVNHSSTPNSLYALGILIASKFIGKGDEITQDYKLWLPEVDSMNHRREWFIDGVTNRGVRGCNAHDAYIHSIQELDYLGQRYAQF